MLNPLLPDVSKLSVTQLEEKINDLQKRYFMTRNAQVRNQIVNLLEDYRLLLSEKAAAANKEKQEKTEELGLDKLINIR